MIGAGWQDMRCQISAHSYERGHRSRCCRRVAISWSCDVVVTLPPSLSHRPFKEQTYGLSFCATHFKNMSFLFVLCVPFSLVGVVVACVCVYANVCVCVCVCVCVWKPWTDYSPRAYQGIPYCVRVPWISSNEQSHISERNN